MSAFAAIVLGYWVLGLLPPIVLGTWLLWGADPGERWFERVATAHAVWSVVGAVTLIAGFALTGLRTLEIPLPALLESHGYEWRPPLLVDGVTIAYCSLLALTYPVVVRFSRPSFHREPGSRRYWFLLTLFAASFCTTVVGGDVDLLYVGWELVGVCSVMLIGFFRANPRSAANAQRALIYYRVSDVGLLGAAIWIHHAFDKPHFTQFVEEAQLPTATLVGLALLFGSLAKSAQLPMSPWLHRAMEGPSASSAIFYGALSVHLGPLLLLRTEPLWMPQPVARWAVAGVGLLTAGYAATVGRTRPDAKTALAYAAMAQLGLIYVEVALGWNVLAIVHVFAHAGLRTWQFLRSSSLIRDFQDNPLVGAGLRLRSKSGWERLVPAPVRGRYYLAAMRLFWLDALQVAFVARPFEKLCGALAWLETRLVPSRGEDA